MRVQPVRIFGALQRHDAFRRGVSAVMSLALFLASCKSDSGTTTPPVTTASVVIAGAPTDNAVIVGKTAQLTATAKSPAGATLDRTFTWQSSNTAAVTVSSTGLVTAVAAGVSTITATADAISSTIVISSRVEVVPSATQTTTSTVLNGAVTMSIPAAAAPAGVNLNVAPAAAPPPAAVSGQATGGQAYDFGPSGTQFPNPISITLKFDKSLITDPDDRASMQWNYVVNGALVPIDSAVVDTVAGTVTAPVSHFSTGVAATNRPTAMSIVSGNNQSAAIGGTVPAPLSIKLVNSAGNPVRNATVTFAVASGGGSLSGQTIAKPNAQGVVTYTGVWTLGSNAGANTVTASIRTPVAAAATVTPITFSATGIAPTITLTPASRTFAATVGGAAPAAQTVAVGSNGNAITGMALGTTTYGSGATGWLTAAISGATTPATVTLTASNTGLAAGSYTATVPVTAANGVTTQNIGVTLNVGGGVVTQIVSPQQPNAGISGGALLPQPTVELRTADGKRLAGGTNVVTVDMNSGDGVLSGTKSVAAVDGVATFTDLSITGVGPMSLLYTTPGAPGIISQTFQVQQVASALVVTGQPFGGPSGHLLGEVDVEVRDGGNRRMATSGTPVTVTLVGAGGTLNGTATVNTVNGVAIFSDLSVTGTGTFTLRFTSGALSQSSSAFAISLAPAIGVSPNTAAFSGVRTLGVFPSSGALITLSGAGSFSVGPITYDANATGWLTAQVSGAQALITASSTGLAAGTYTATVQFNGVNALPNTVTVTLSVSPLPVAQIAIIKQPVATKGGVPFTTQPQIEIRDATGTKITTATTTVTASIASGTGGTLTGTKAVNAVGGVATFTDLGITGNGAYTIGFAAGGVPSVASGTITLVATASQLAITTQPAGSVSGAVLTTQPVVEIRDAGNNKVTTATDPVTVSILSGAGTLVGTTTVNAVAGVATFTNLQVNGGGPIVLAFNSGTLFSAQANPFTTAQTAAKLVIKTQPSTTALAGAALAQQPVIEVQDASGARIIGGTTAVTASVASGNGVANGTVTVNAVNGTATFTNLGVRGTGAQTIGFAAGGLTGATSTALTITPVIALTTPPSGSTTGSAFTGQPVITFRDVTNATLAMVTDNVVAAVTTGGTLSGTTTIAAVAGVATFTNLTITGSGNAQLNFTADGVTIQSAPFNVTPLPPTQLVLITQPANATSGNPFGTQPVLELRDATNTKVVGANNSVAVTVASGTGVLGGTTTKLGANGTVTFTDLQITGLGPHTITFTTAGMAPVTSAAFFVTQVPTKLAVTTQPAGAVSGFPMTTQPVVQIQDAGGAVLVGNTSVVTVAKLSGSGNLVGTLTATAVNGVATFTNLEIDGTGAYTLGFTSGSLQGANANSIQTTQLATQVVLVTPPSTGAQAGAAFAAQPVLEIRDGLNQKVLGSTAAVVAAVSTGNGAVSGTATVNAVNGTATFSTLGIIGTGTQTLKFTSGALTQAVSGNVAITPVLGVQTQPSSNIFSGVAFAQQPVIAIRDVNGNTITAATDNVTAAIVNGTGTLTGTATVAAVAGVATFTNLVISGAPGNFTLGYTAPAVNAASVNSTTQGLTQLPTQLAIVTQPSTTAASGVALVTQPVVEIRDVGNVKVQGSTLAVVASLASGTGTLSGTTTVNAVNGTATFTNLVITGATGNNTIQFAVVAPALGPISANVTAVTQTASKLVMQTQPSANVFSGVAFAQQPVVKIADPGNLVVATSSANVTAAIATGTGVLSGTTTVAAVNGVATFTNLVVTGTPGAVTLSFTSGGVSSINSTSMNLTQQPVALAITTQPSATAASGVPLVTQPVVAIRDAGNATVQGSTLAVVASLASGTGTLTGTTTVNAVNGVATFTNLGITGATGNNTIQFAVVTGATLGPISANVTAVTQTASKAVLTTQPSANVFSGVQFAQQPVVQLQDPGSLLVGSSTANVTAAIATGTGVLSGTTTVAAVGGVATFTDLKISGTPGNFTLTFTSGGVTAATSGTMALTQQPVSLAITTQPSTTAASGVALATQPVVAIRDAGNTTVAGSTLAVVASLASGTGTLVGTTTVNAVNGVATFTNLKINGPTGNNTIQFAVVTGATLGPISANVTALTQTPSQVVFTTQPSSNVFSGVPFAQQPVVQLQDPAGLLVTSSTANVTVAVATGTGTLGGTTTVAAVGGVATFTNLSLTGAPGNFTLSFASAGTTTATSGTMALTQQPAGLAITTQPSAAASSGVALLNQPVVEIRDAGNAKVAGSTLTVVASLASGTAVLSGTTSVAAVNGVATFTNLKLTGAAGNNTIQFSVVAPALGPISANATSLTQTVSQAVITTQPAGSASGAAMTTQPVVELRDAGNLIVATSSANVTASLASGTGALSGTTTVAAVNGVATFTNLKYTGAAGNFTLAFSAAAATPATSNTVTHAQTATQLVIATQPAGAQKNLAFTTQPVVEVRDADNVKVPAATNAVTVAIATQPGGATLTGTNLTVNAVAGVATFAGLKVDVAGNYTFNFTAAGLTTATSTPALVVSNGPPEILALKVGTNATQNVTNGQQVAIPIIMDMSQSQGDTLAALSFAITWDPTKFQYVSNLNGSFGSGTAYTKNTTQTATGTLTIGIFDSSDGLFGSSASNTIFTVTLQAIAAGTTSNVTANVTAAGNVGGTSVLPLMTIRNLALTIP